MHFLSKTLSEATTAVASFALLGSFLHMANSFLSADCFVHQRLHPCNVITFFIIYRGGNPQPEAIGHTQTRLQPESGAGTMHRLQP